MGKLLWKYKTKWIPSSKNKKLAQIELAKYEEDKDRGRIGLDRTEVSWKEIRKRYLDYSQASKSPASLKLDEFTFNDIEEFAPNINSVKDLTITFAESFFAWLKKEKKNSDATVKRKGTTVKNIGSKLVDWDIVKYNPLQKLKIKDVLKYLLNVILIITLSPFYCFTCQK